MVSPEICSKNTNINNLNLLSNHDRLKHPFPLHNQSCLNDGEGKHSHEGGNKLYSVFIS